MKLLVFTKDDEGFYLLKSFFENEVFFNIDFFNFIPKNRYDAIVVESTNVPIVQDIEDIPICILGEKMHDYKKDNYIYIEEVYSKDKLIQTLKQLYEMQNIPTSQDIVYTDQLKFCNRNLLGQNIWLSISRDSLGLCKLNESLSLYNHMLTDINIDRIKLVISEILITYPKNKLNLCLNIYQDKVQISIFLYQTNLFFLNEYCDQVCLKDDGYKKLMQLEFKNILPDLSEYNSNLHTDTNYLQSKHNNIIVL